MLDHSSIFHVSAHGSEEDDIIKLNPGEIVVTFFQTREKSHYGELFG
jgi:hypothetical protein